MGNNEDDDEGVGRVRTPRGDQVIGIVIDELGHGRFRLYCTDGNTRTGRIPGSKRRKMWIKRDNVVLVEPWDIQGDEKGDIVWKYSNAQAKWLEDRGYLDEIKEYL